MCECFHMDFLVRKLDVADLFAHRTNIVVLHYVAVWVFCAFAYHLSLQSNIM